MHIDMMMYADCGMYGFSLRDGIAFGVKVSIVRRMSYTSSGDFCRGYIRVVWAS